MRRHEVLRATFPMVGHRPVVVIHRDSTAVLSVIEVTTGGETDRLERVRLACEEEARRPFDLARGPVLRLVLFRLSPAEHVLLVNVHHIVFDGWSLGIFLKELATLYAAFLEGRPSPLPPLSIPYSDIARESTSASPGRGLERPYRLLDEEARGHSAPPGPAIRPPTTGWDELPRGATPDRAGPRAFQAPQGSQPGRGGHSLHDPPGGPGGVAPPIHGADGYRRRRSDRGADLGQHEGLDRQFHQYAGAPHGRLGRADIPRTHRPCPADGLGRLFPPGVAIQHPGQCVESRAGRDWRGNGPGDAQSFRTTRSPPWRCRD